MSTVPIPHSGVRLSVRLFGAALIALAGCNGGGGESSSGDTGTTSTGSTGPGSTSTGSTSTGPGSSGSTVTGDSTGPSAVCGNGIVEGDEVCDDGNQDPLDGCEPDCTPSSGKEVWTATYDHEGKDDGVSVAAKLPDGRLLAVGSAQTATGYDTLLWFLNPDGTEDSVVVEDIGAVVASDTDEFVNGLVVHDDGSFVVAGHVEVDPEADDWDVVLRRYDDQVQEAWTYMWASMGGGGDFARDLALGPNGVYLIAGETPGTNGDDGLLLAMDEAGNEVFATLFDGDGAKDDRFYAVAYDGTQIWVGGLTDLDPLLGDSKWLVAGYDQTGAQQWKDAFAGQPDKLQRARDIVTDADGNAYVTGVIGSLMGGDLDAWVVSYEPSGARTWADLYDSPDALVDQGVGIARRDDDGAVFVAGYTVALGEQQNILMGRWASDGTPVWTTSFDGDLSLGDFGTAVVVDDDGYPVFFGSTVVSGEGANAWARKVYP